MVAKKSKIKIIPLGGLEEIGKNLTLFEFKDEILILDCGVAFPDDDMFGIDLVIPDMSYLQKNREKIKGLVLTHGHEDHIGAIPYLLKDINIPIYGTRLTLGILEKKLKEHGLSSTAKLNSVNAGDKIKLGSFGVEFIRTNHSIADSVAIALHTPVGIIVHTGDFKIDSTPIDGEILDLARFGELGKKGVLALLSDSTNVERPGFSMSERKVGETFEDLFSSCESRIIVATFASNVHRVQQIITCAAKHHRKVAVSGRSMESVVTAAYELGYLKVPKGVLIELSDINKYPDNQLVIITTGSQGEPMAALSRIATLDHKKVEIKRGDLVIISASPIPGNEKLVAKVIDELFKHGAEVIYKSIADIHVSGHACQEELKIILSVTKPKYFIPVHGEYRHLMQHAQLAHKMGMAEDHTFIMKIGQVLELDSSSAKITGSVPAGRVFVDGSGVGDVGNIVIRDRKLLSEDGLIVVVVGIDSSTNEIVSGPDVISRGFVYVRESEDLMEQARIRARDAILNCTSKNNHDWNSIKTAVKNALSQYLYVETKRSPMILPVIMEV
ncbi:MAG: ribonuclease J [Clostridia bacterium]|nr:ribonuclease J [Clostridia bacterium]